MQSSRVLRQDSQAWQARHRGHHAAGAERLCWNLGSARDWPIIRPAAVVVLGTSHGPKPFLSGFRMLTLNRSDFPHCSRSVSVTNSNRRVRTRTHGGVAGVGG